MVINKHRERRKLIRKIWLYCIRKLIILLGTTKRFTLKDLIRISIYMCVLATFELTYDPPPSY